MLHELLLALRGVTGDFVIDERERREALGLRGPAIPDSAPTFRLAPDLSFLQPSERCVIEKLIPLGFYYRELDRFVKAFCNLIPSNVKVSPENPDFTEGKPRSPSIYRRAIGNGIVEILSIYISAILQVEQKLLSDPKPILATVTQGLNKFHVILPPLHDLMMEIVHDDIRGGKLLNYLHKRCHCGVPELQLCIQRLLWHGHQVMYNQLASWMVYGILQDQYGEFFIRKEENTDSETAAACFDNSEKFLRTSDDASLTNWHYGYHIFLDMLPDYIHMRVAESILFAGKAIKVLRNPSPSLKYQVAMLHQHVPKGSYKPLGLPNFQIDATIAANFPGDELLPQFEADKIDLVFQELKKASEFHKKSFEHAVDSIRVVAANHLWQLVVVRADLNGHLKALKDYFLLAKGDFFQCFLEESRQLMRLPPRQSTAEADLKIPFQLAALKTVGDDDKHFSRVSLRISSFGSNAASQIDLSNLGIKFRHSTEYSVDGWDGISLHYAVIWPLQLFLTQDVLSKYCRVFQYLIRLKRTQMELEKSWASVMHQEHLDFAKHRNDKKGSNTSHLWHRRSTMWKIREHMVFLIRNLQFYIQVDVIESQWNILQNHLQESHDFTELVGFHQEYLAALISQSFLDIGSVSRILDSIMKLCLLFCWITENADTKSSSSELDNIIEEFNKKSNSLYTILRSSRLAGSQRAPYLRRFLLRLNFNSFFESAAKGVLNIGRARPNMYPSTSTDDLKP